MNVLITKRDLVKNQKNPWPGVVLKNLGDLQFDEEKALHPAYLVRWGTGPHESVFKATELRREDSHIFSTLGSKSR